MLLYAHTPYHQKQRRKQKDKYTPINYIVIQKHLQKKAFNIQSSQVHWRLIFYHSSAVHISKKVILCKELVFFLARFTDLVDIAIDWK